ncbi:hypothetical protein CONCODRAFT_13557 [Conidiobolus coronatus NRRL 28638]|uniref:G-protein coupled receptors family 1 profile domain-containing protein n=1 Tax=Conidiobolus coronatus (strain ATCC 28846 / CBS 209.66 / NRRL 28638) TaxID=796925 RepID=A0A137NQI8_CONC2|nr:hypothetical protein CONCODRAFT_13557 [Conidiobolus coronatus NRRL 28638]|eukprot:KXN65011.1 hypothetical protein CONCODRAFT_13557 [Conidiobolus coronatus NRRL 28638]
MADQNVNDPSGVYAHTLRIVYFVLSACGLTFSSILLLILGKKLRKSKHSDIILTILAVSVDCVASGGLLFRAIFTQYPYNMLKEHFGWCAYDAFFNSLILAYSGYILSILSLQRMLLIVFNFRINIWFWLGIAILMTFSLWGQAIYLNVNKNAQLSIIGVFCIAKNNAMGKPFYLTLMTCTLATYSLTIISYLSIIIFSCKQCLNQLSLNLDKAVVYRECRIIIFKSLLFLVPYMLIYSGRMYTWFYEFSTGKQRTWTMEYVSVTMISSCVVVNCLTVLYMHKEVNKDLIKWFVKFKSLFHHE